MKKRILALALAGTTAFSVFGAAISANAIWVPQGNNWVWQNSSSTDIDLEIDAYVSYAPDVAQKIAARSVDDLTDTQVNITVNNQTVTIYVDANATASENTDGDAVYTSVDAYLIQTYGKKTTEYTVTLSPSAAMELKEEYTELPLVYITQVNGSTSGKWIRWGKANNPTWTAKEDLEGFYVRTDDLSKFTDTTDGVLPEGVDIYYAPDNEAVVTDDVLEGLSEETADRFAVFEDTDFSVMVENGELVGDDIETVLNDLQVTAYDNGYGYNGKYYADAEALLVGLNANKGNDYYGGKELNAEIAVVTSGNAVAVWDYLDDTGFTGDDYTDWRFNPNMDGNVTIDPVEVVTYIQNGQLVIEKDEVSTVYAFDFIPASTPYSSTSEIASAWNGKNTTATASALRPYMAVDTYGDITMHAEKGRGNPNYGIRYDVVSEWEDFLEELALNDDFGYSESLDEFRSNYLDMFYSDPVFDPNTGEQIGIVPVDLYNIGTLLEDIWELHEAQSDVNKGIAGYYNANTSELIYLMQQYDKYIGNYIDKAEVSSDEWGDLLLSILDAATESDFRSASEYRRYQNEVEDLRDAYELATTTNMIREAEVGMYNLLVSANNRYRASTNADTAALGTSLEGLYFNVGNVPAEYSVLPSNQSTNVDYYNYNYYVAALNNTFNVGIITTNNIPNSLGFSNSLSRGYYSLYPALDYLQAGNTAMQYPGNGAAGTNYGVSTTDEYEWFLNVYELATNMSSSNTKQGSVDAVNDALNAAVADLAVTRTPNSVEVGAVEDAMTKYEGKIESDYDEGYYSKYEQAYDYAENTAEGLWQTRIAAMIVGVSGEALTYQGTQVTVTKNDMKTLETAISNGQAALEAIRNSEDYNAAQVNALNKAIDAAQYIVDLYEGTVTRTNADVQSVNHVATALVGDKDQFVKSDLDNAIDAIDAAINYSEIVMGWSQNDAGKWMYGTEEGYLSNGWNKIGKTWFYFKADGTAMQSDWLQENGNWYWFNSNCGAATGWAKVDGSWYYFKGNNAMKTGWEKVDGNWYYMASSGKMVTGWCEVNGKWYYFSKESNSLGQMLYNTTVDGYKLGADGAWIK